MAAPGQEIRIRVAGVYVRDGKILLVRHFKNGRRYWLLPGGGCEFGETLDAAVERELVEECGVQTKTGRLLFISESIHPEKTRHVVNFVYLGSLLQGEPKLCETGGVLDAVAWVPRAEFSTLTFLPNFRDELARHWDSGFTLPFESYGLLWVD